MKLSSPSFGIYLVSVILVLVIILTKYTRLDVPLLSEIVRGKDFPVMLLAYLLLWIGVTFNV